MKNELYGQMRPGFAEEMERNIGFFASTPIVRDFGVMRNLATSLLEKYADTLAPSEFAALEKFGSKCAELASGWSFYNDPYKLLPSMSTDFPSLSGTR